MDGILIVDKPAGITSHDVVARCRRILRTKRIGHTGTLDPFATGVIVVLVGKATRLAQFLDKDAKSYEAVVRLGFATDTGDRTGELRITNDELRTIPDELNDISIEKIETVLRDFRGEIWQTPPMYSAKKIAGKKLYELARQGIEIEREAVKVTNYELRITNYGLHKNTFEGVETVDFGLFVTCSAGTYIRVLAEDIGRKLNVGAHLAELRRVKAGNFSIERAVTLEELETLAAAEKVAETMISMNEAVAHLAEVKIAGDEIGKLKNGVRLRRDLSATKNGDFLRITGENDDLLAIGFYLAAEKEVQPKLVLM